MARGGESARPWLARGRMVWVRRSVVGVGGGGQGGKIMNIGVVGATSALAAVGVYCGTYDQQDQPSS